MVSIISQPLDMVEKRSWCLNNVFFEVLNSFLASNVQTDIILNRIQSNLTNFLGLRKLPKYGSKMLVSNLYYQTGYNGDYCVILLVLSANYGFIYCLNGTYRPKLIKNLVTIKFFNPDSPFLGSCTPRLSETGICYILRIY